MSKAYSGSFIPINKHKYIGDWSRIKYRSSWERWLMTHLDQNNRVTGWSSEETIIPYFSRLDEKKRRYYMDFKVTYDNSVTYLFEVKPYKETIKPIPPKRQTSKSINRFKMEVYNYGVNTDKWIAAQKLADKNKWKFRLVTENTLRRLGWKG